MKIFVSYSRRDAGDFAAQISESLMEDHEIFTDVDDIQLGDVWSNVIEENIATCDIFIVVVTFAALRSAEVEKEVLLAKKHNKKVIPCIYKGLKKNSIKWDLARFQGVEFGSKYELAREIYWKIEEYAKKVTPKAEAKLSPNTQPKEENQIEKKFDPIIERDIVKAPEKHRRHNTRIAVILVIIGSLFAGVISIYYYLNPSDVNLITQSQPAQPTQPILKPTLCESQVCFVKKWDVAGTTSDDFDNPEYITVGSSDNVYTTNSEDDRVDKYDSDGEYIASWGSPGEEAGNFTTPRGIAIDSTGNVYVVDSDNNRTQKFDIDGNFIKEWGSSGTEKGEFSTPFGMAIDSSDNLYVADKFNNRIQKFDENGTYLTSWGANGTELGNFDGPSGIAVDSSDNVLVSDTWNNRIQKFDENGKYLASWGSYGQGKGYFDSPYGITTDSSDNVFVTDTWNNRTQVFDKNGDYLVSWGTHGSGNGQFKVPRGIALDSSGNILIADSHNSRVQVFSVGNLTSS